MDLLKSVTHKPSDLDKLDNYWICGPTGTGKSLGVRNKFPGLYNKPLNKWWCSYAGEDTVLLDDFGKDHACLGNHLKNWADHYAFVGEKKGGSETIRPRRIVVTSNYIPEEIWEDKGMLEPIMRRFKVIVALKDKWLGRFGGVQTPPLFI